MSSHQSRQLPHRAIYTGSSATSTNGTTWVAVSGFRFYTGGLFDSRWDIVTTSLPRDFDFQVPTDEREFVVPTWRADNPTPFSVIARVQISIRRAQSSQSQMTRGLSAKTVIACAASCCDGQVHCSLDMGVLFGYCLQVVIAYRKTVHRPLVERSGHDASYC